MNIIVAHPNAQHSHRLALAVQKTGWLKAYVTQLYYDNNRWPYSLTSLVPYKLQVRIEELFFRRNIKELDTTKVITYGLWSEILFIILNRAGLARKFREQWLLQRARKFSIFVGQLALNNTDMIIGTDAASCDAFRFAKKSGVLCVLDLSHPHINTCMRIEEEEKRLDPEFSRTFDTYALTPDDLSYMIKEVNSADKFIVASSFSKESLVENGIDEGRISIIPYGVNLERFHPPKINHPSTKEQADVLRVLFVGRIGQRKGIGYLLKSIHELQGQIPISATLVGNCRGDNTIYEKFNDNFTHIKRLGDSDFPQVYHSADVFVLPSLIEGFGLVILEAMASGLPVITTPNTGGRDIITDGVDGFIIPVRDTEILKQYLTFLYKHPDERIKMGIAARETAERYSWDRYYEEIASVLHKFHDDSDLITT